MGTIAIPLYLNPAAGRGRAGRHAHAIVALFAAQNIFIELHESTAAGDLEQLAFRASTQGAKEILVAGGDGSIHEVANGILAAGSDTAIGVIPVGTGNDFAKSISTADDWHQASLALAGRLQDKTPYKRIDAGKMNERFFANGAGIGLDAKINTLAAEYRWPIGSCVYLLAALEGILDGITTPTVRLHYTDTTYQGPIVLANISNGPWAGGMFHIAPMANNQDGFFDLILAEPMSRRRLVSLFPRLIKGKHIGRPGVRHARITEFLLETDTPLPSHLDGERQPLQSRFAAHVLPGALKVI